MKGKEIREIRKMSDFWKFESQQKNKRYDIKKILFQILEHSLFRKIFIFDIYNLNDDFLYPLSENTFWKIHVICWFAAHHD